MVGSIKRTYIWGLTSILLLGWGVTAHAVVRHDLTVAVSPAAHHLSVIDRITFPEGSERPLSFLLHAGMQPTARGGAKLLSITPAGDRGVPLERISIELDPGQRELVLEYSGEIYHPIQQLSEEYARSFSVSPGLISNEGVYLSGASYWVPQFNVETMSFSLEATLPKDWRSVTQGARSGRRHKDDKTIDTWTLDTPQEEIYLIAGVFEEYNDVAGAVDAMVFLRQADPALANKYLGATKQYLELYRHLIGPYPYRKFALVENFWETGYGMPSFTLLGPRVIRFPFILHSSYPHEILHNWWGNGVYVDYHQGNWAEGLTSYLADHLIKEQRGQGVAYRRQVLQKYTDYVRDQKDFPLTEFRSRHSSVTEAVGYGKTLMLFHMLRQELGDETFIDALRQLYRRYRFKVASFDDVATVFGDASKKPLGRFFRQWVTRSGAPSLRVLDVQVSPRRDGEAGFVLSAMIEQTQDGNGYELTVPIVIHLAGEDAAYQTRIYITSKRQRFELRLPARPLRLDVDPEFDVFRRLDRNEIPPALTQAFGASRALIVLPSAASGPVRDAYRNMARSWAEQPRSQIDVKYDNEIDELPADRAVWILGWDNRFRFAVRAALSDYAYEDKDGTIEITDETLRRETHSLVVVTRHPDTRTEALAWVATDNAASIPGLGRKLPHYGKYSYLAFTGDEPANVVKGQWPVIGSPMSVVIVPPGAEPKSTGPSTLASRKALAELPPVFSSQRMWQDIEHLAAPEMTGRGLGSVQLDRAADHIAKQFRLAGLQPGGDSGGYFQFWTAKVDGLDGMVPLKNVIGVLPGSNPQHAGQSVVLGAHYDHLGSGWPDVRKGNEGKVHPGADDNASGIAVMLELARVLGTDWQPERSVVFVAFTGEEADKLGSRYYVRHAGTHPTGKIIGMLNLDTVGRLGNNPVFVLGTGSAREWVHIFRGAGYVTGVAVKSVVDDYGSSDHTSFLDHGIPAVQFFSGANADYHRPSDTVDKIDAAGLIKVAAVVKEAVEYLASRPDALHANLKASPKVETKGRVGRRVLLGTVPDFAFDGPGVRLTGVTADTPAEKAGLRSGDIIVGIDDSEIHDLRGFSENLKALKIGDQVIIRFVRGGSEQSVAVTLVAR
jgi:hypothetical protein